MVSGETVCVCDVVTWCDREGSRGKGNSGKENGKGGFVGMGGEGHREGARGNQTGAGVGVWQGSLQICAHLQEVIMGGEHYHESASLQDLRVSRLLNVGFRTCAKTGK